MPFNSSVFEYIRFYRSVRSHSHHGIFAHLDSRDASTGFRRIFVAGKVWKIYAHRNLKHIIIDNSIADFRLDMVYSCSFKVRCMRAYLLLLVCHFWRCHFASNCVFLLGNCAFLIGPIVGWIRDVTQSYVICFHSLTVILALCAIPWFIEIAILQMCHKKR